MEQRHRWSKRATALGGALLVVSLVIGVVWMIRGLMASKEQKQQRTVQTITVIRPPPPPPPEETPPPPPPPEKIEQQVQQQNEPEPSPDNPPAPSPQLGLDAEGGAGDDGFGLAARKGGSDIAGTGGAAFAWYTGKLKDEMTDRLSSDPKLRAKKFTVGVRVWIEADGRIKSVRLTNSTGNRDTDGAIAAALALLDRLSEAPPLEMPQPITLQIVSRT
jgi:protein TonB